MTVMERGRDRLKISVSRGMARNNVNIDGEGDNINTSTPTPNPPYIHSPVGGSVFLQSPYNQTPMGGSFIPNPPYFQTPMDTAPHIPHMQIPMGGTIPNILHMQTPMRRGLYNAFPHSQHVPLYRNHHMYTYNQYGTTFTPQINVRAQERPSHRSTNHGAIHEGDEHASELESSNDSNSGKIHIELDGEGQVW